MKQIQAFCNCGASMEIDSSSGDWYCSYSYLMGIEHYRKVENDPIWDKLLNCQSTHEGMKCDWEKGHQGPHIHEITNQDFRIWGDPGEDISVDYDHLEGFM